MPQIKLGEYVPMKLKEVIPMSGKNVEYLL
jgi:hypothetical protein